MSHSDHLHNLNTVAVHLALLKNGKALLFSGSHKQLWNWTKGEANIWDPNDPLHSEDSNLRRNLFCAGHCFLPDGRLLVAGGQSTFNYPHVIFGTVIGVLPLALKISGKEAADHDIHTFDPDESDVNLQWKRHNPGMSKARWYPTCVTLPDGNALIVSGTWSHGYHALFGGFMNKTYQIFDYTTNTVSSPQPFGFDEIKMYPYLHVLPGNSLFVHSEKTTKFWDITKKQFLSAEFTTVTGGTRTYPGMGTCVLLPLQHDDQAAKVLLIGGSMSIHPGKDDDATSIPEMLTIDLSDPSNSSGWQAKPSHLRRFLCDSVILPDGKILVTNGAEKGTADSNQNEVMPIELFDPETESWSVIGTLKKPRLYHSTAILLSDGRVLVAGSTGHDFTRAIFNPKQHFEQEIETINPPYINSSNRPEITNTPTSISYDSEFSVATGNNSDIEKISLIRLSSTTHNNNMDQRCLFLHIVQKSDSGILIRSPKDGNWAPPGYYMLFVIDSNGIPSTGKILQLF